MYFAVFIYFLSLFIAIFSILFLIINILIKKRFESDLKNIIKAIGFYLLAFVFPFFIFQYSDPMLAFVLSPIFFFFGTTKAGAVFEKSIWRNWKFWVFLIVSLLFFLPLISKQSFIICDRTSRDGYYVQFDTQIMSELSQIRRELEYYYYNNERSYIGYKDSSESNWSDIKDNIPNCSKDLLQEQASEISFISSDRNLDEYQMNIEESGEDYVVWAPLCRATHDKIVSETSYFLIDTFLKKNAADLDKYIVYHCVDSGGNAEEYQGTPVNLETTSCKELFAN